MEVPEVVATEDDDMLPDNILLDIPIDEIFLNMSSDILNPSLKELSKLLESDETNNNNIEVNKFKIIKRDNIVLPPVSNLTQLETTNSDVANPIHFKKDGVLPPFSHLKQFIKSNHNNNNDDNFQLDKRNGSLLHISRFENFKETKNINKIVSFQLHDKERVLPSTSNFKQHTETNYNEVDPFQFNENDVLLPPINSFKRFKETNNNSVALYQFNKEPPMINIQQFEETNNNEVHYFQFNEKDLALLPNNKQFIETNNNNEVDPYQFNDTDVEPIINLKQFKKQNQDIQKKQGDETPAPIDSENSDRRQTLRVDKEVEISTIISAEKEAVGGNSSPAEVRRLVERLTAADNQNKKLKDLLICHLDLIQQQNDFITKREKLFLALKQENDSLKTKIAHMEKRVSLNQRHSINPAPIVHAPNPPVTSTVVKNDSSSSQLMFNSFTELLLPDKTKSYIFNSDVSKPKTNVSYELNRNSEPDVAGYVLTELSEAVILEDNFPQNNYKMIENKRSFLKKEIKPDPRSEHLYTVTSNSGNPVIQKIQRSRRRTSASIGSLSRLPKSPVIKSEPVESHKIFDDDKSFDHSFSVNKKSKMINTYGKQRTGSIPKRPTHFTGSLSDRLQLIDTTPTGEDPYQLGEADMREQSPIPKLMLQKTNHGRIKICTDATGHNTISTRRVYDAPSTETSAKLPNKIKLENRYDLTSTITHSDIKKEKPSPPKTMIVHEPDLDLVKTEPTIDWRIYSPTRNTPSLCDFSYGENSNNFALPNLDAVEFQELFETEPVTGSFSLDTLHPDDCGMEKVPNDKTKRRAIRTTSLIAHPLGGESIDTMDPDNKRGRKRALSTTGLTKSAKQNLPKPVGPKPKIVKGKAPACRGKKSPVPGMMTREPYHTLVGDPDLSWYLGLDPDVKMEDVDPSGDYKASTVEVPRWREKPYTSCYSLEGTENLDDKVFEKRHQKLEAEERRQLRWHMRRIREQRHVERLRQRQRDPWGSGNGSALQQPGMFTVWPQPQRDVRLIEITDSLPVMAFGENLPELPPADFMLPWVRTSKALKRSKRSKTLH